MPSISNSLPLMMSIPSVKEKNSNNHVYQYSTIHDADADAAPNFKPRYVLEETGPVASRKTSCNNARNVFVNISCCLLSWSYTICSYPIVGKRRVAFCIFIMLVWTTFYLSRSIDINLGKYEVAKQQSYHYFGSISEQKWQLLRERVHKIRSEQMLRIKLLGDTSTATSKSGTKEIFNQKHFYQHNYPAEFTCPHERRVGGTKGGGGRWLCDPRNIKIASDDRVANGGNACLIYTSHSDLNDFAFELELLDILGGPSSCEIHVFNPNDDGQVDVPPGINYHPWGFKSSLNLEEVPNMRSIEATAMSLDHEGFTIDLFSLDCSGCEFDIAQDLTDHEHFGSSRFDPLVFMQMVIQVHGVNTVEMAHRFFQTFQDEGYVRFHKSLSKNGKQGEHDYGFLKLTKDFFLEI